MARLHVAGEVLGFFGLPDILLDRSSYKNKSVLQIRSTQISKADDDQSDRVFQQCDKVNSNLRGRRESAAPEIFLFDVTSGENGGHGGK